MGLMGRLDGQNGRYHQCSKKALRKRITTEQQTHERHTRYTFSRPAANFVSLNIDCVTKGVPEASRQNTQVLDFCRCYRDHGWKGSVCRPGGYPLERKYISRRREAIRKLKTAES
jgi:hypothetical protein